LVQDLREGKVRSTQSGARLKERASNALGLVALSGFVVVAACAAASITLWELSGGTRHLRGDTTKSGATGTHAEGVPEP
jgi:hypothetical protein